MNPQRKYPVVLDMYFGDRYRTAGQLLAHAGAFYVSTGKFGVPRQWETMPGLEEAMVVQQAMLKHPNVDRRRIFVISHSSSTVIASELVDANPELWRGVILSSPVAVPRIHPNPSGYPSIFISKGDQDGPRAFDYRNSREPFTREAYVNLLRMKTDIQHTGHDYDRDQQRESFKAMVKFILTE
jgi:pimeloyl-ACP methyl ester carboxylesterase